MLDEAFGVVLEQFFRSWFWSSFRSYIVVASEVVLDQLSSCIGATFEVPRLKMLSDLPLLMAHRRALPARKRGPCCLIFFFLLRLTRSMKAHYNVRGARTAVKLLRGIERIFVETWRG